VSQNHYQILGVLPNATAAEIKRAYRQLVVRFHPDKHGGDTRFEDRFKAVAVAYGVLGDPGKRASYDFQLTQAARRLEEQRRAQQYRPASQHVYGVPMPPPAPLRTRPPAGSRERHYQPIRRQQTRFTLRDWALTLGIMLSIVLFTLAVKVTMDRVTASSNYDDGLRAYAGGRLEAAHSYMEEALNFRATYGPALRRHGELELLLNHDPRAARSDFEQALRESSSARDAADLLYRIGRCEAALNRPEAAEINFSRALALDSTLSAALLARGETRLLDLHRLPQAVADLSRGLHQRRRAHAATPWRYVQVHGVALAAVGRYTDARNEYLRVLQAYPQQAQTHFLLGCLATSVGDTATACQFYNRAVELGYYNARAAQQKCR